MNKQRLRWKCRRGMQELDLLLEPFLDGGYAALDTTGREAFSRLLEAEDDQLWDWLSGRVTPPGPALAAVVTAIRRR